MTPVHAEEHSSTPPAARVDEPPSRHHEQEGNSPRMWTYYKLFISHAWGFNAEFHRLVDFLNGMQEFDWQNLSTLNREIGHAIKRKRGASMLPPYPFDEGFTGGVITVGDVRRRLCDQIEPASTVLILGGLYPFHRGLIQLEIDLAQDYLKPIIGIRPWDGRDTPVEVKSAAVEMVDWTPESIVDAVKRCSNIP